MDAQERPITYRIAVGSQQGRKVFTLQTIPPSNAGSSVSTLVANTTGFSLHAGIAAEAYQRDKLERLSRYIALHGCRVLRRLKTIASVRVQQYQKID